MKISAPPAEEQVRRTEEAAAGGNLVEGDPSTGCTAMTAHKSLDKTQNKVHVVSSGRRERGGELKR